ncbi:hypothetical protein [Allobranchiibius sp. GilTou73]|uniref:hypothetical protein n=1 Tax=Allobranchiibius sp. GilTou73 TaxID=2904523 RepID=UPI001F36B986|nr:hypothetical protein [Allobranchiibius sp. GilTou73]UIJ35064.1 hypothetical protein LVQ62_01225 [Allobranchiibius sp. GilTou73]
MNLDVIDVVAAGVPAVAILSTAGWRGWQWLMGPGPIEAQIKRWRSWLAVANELESAREIDRATLVRQSANEEFARWLAGTEARNEWKARSWAKVAAAECMAIYFLALIAWRFAGSPASRVAALCALLLTVVIGVGSALVVAVTSKGYNRTLDRAAAKRPVRQGAPERTSLQR